MSTWTLIITATCEAADLETAEDILIKGSVPLESAGGVIDVAIAHSGDHVKRVLRRTVDAFVRGDQVLEYLYDNDSAVDEGGW